MECRFDFICMSCHDVNFTFILVLVMLVLLILAYRRRWRRLTLCGCLMFLACVLVLIVDAVLQLSPLLGAVTVVSMTLLLLAFVLWLSSPGGLGTLGAALLTLAAGKPHV